MKVLGHSLGQRAKEQKLKAQGSQTVLTVQSSNSACIILFMYSHNFYMLETCKIKLQLYFSPLMMVSNCQKLKDEVE